MALPMRAVAACLLIAAGGCGGAGGSSGSVPALPSAPKHASDVIKHVVVIVQENRSFDNLFQGYPGADTVASGPASDGTTVALQPVSMTHGVDPGHNYQDFVASFDGGKMDGFDRISGLGAETHLAYSYVPRSEAQPYFDLASSYALADRMFQSNNSNSYAAHQYIIAAQADNVINVPTAMPWGCDAPAGTVISMLDANSNPYPAGVPPCFDYQTIGDLLDTAGVTWAYYAPSIADANTADPAGALWSPYDAIRHIRYGADWSKNQISPETTILSDIASGSLRGVSIVTPDAFNSDHARFPSTTGPLWVDSIVNAVGQSPYWNDTAIFVIWDDWGGWYDHVLPPHIDQNGPGLRVPLLAISPYAKHGYVSHVQYEMASLVTYIEEVYHLPTLGQRDVTATPPDDMFDYSQKVAPLTGVRASASSLRKILSRAPSHVAPDD